MIVKEFLEMVSVLIWVAVAVFMFVRQFQPHPLNERRLMILPLALVVLGARGMSGVDSFATVSFFALNAVMAVGFGIWRGLSFRVWAQGNGPWAQGTLVTLVLWIVSVVMRLVLAGAGHVAGISMGSATAELSVLLGITFAAQNLVIWTRSTSLIPVRA
jgi:hypothetical protein